MKKGKTKKGKERKKERKKEGKKERNNAPVLSSASIDMTLTRLLHPSQRKHSNSYDHV